MIHENPQRDAGRRACVRRSRPAVVLGLLFTAIASFTRGAYEVAQPGNRRCLYLSPADGTPQFYHLYVPTSYDPARPTPVVFSLHGFGGRTGPAGTGWQGRWADLNRWLLVRPDGRGNQNWDGIGEDDIFDVLNDLRQSTPDHPAFNIDSLRLYAEGGSMGGHGAFRLATRHAGVFAAVAPVAGWTTYGEFYRHWYDSASPSLPPGYVDPARLPLLETASSLNQAENAVRCPMLVTYDLNDAINPPRNALEMIRRLRAAGSVQVVSRAGERGHCGSYDGKLNFRFFQDKTLDPWPRSVRLATNTLRHNRAYWLTVERLRVLNRWAHIVANVDGQQISITCDNVLAFGLNLDPRLVSLADPVTLRVNGGEPFTSTARPHVRVEARLSEDPGVTTWQVGDDARANEQENAPCKTHRLSGPIDDALRSRFVVIYGAQPGSRRAQSGADRDDAQRFATDWNAWMTLHWGNQRPPVGRRDDWWKPPYPFRPGPNVHPHAWLVTPQPDTAFTLGTLPRDRNLVLFGDPQSNWIVANFADRLPIRLGPATDGGVLVQCGNVVHAGDYVNYMFVAPHPLAREHYVIVSRGYLSSRIDPGTFGAQRVGKDLEALPFYWPDYVVWDAHREPGRTVQPPLKYLPGTFLEAGFFGENWTLWNDAPPPRVTVTSRKRRSGVYDSPAVIRMSAEPVPGAFGLAGIEYRVNEGPWQEYRDPVTVVAEGRVVVQARARHNSGRYVYRPAGDSMRGVALPSSVSHPSTLRLELHEHKSLWQRVLGFFGKD